MLPVWTAALRRSLAALWLIAGVVTVLAWTPTSAHAGTWTLDSCTQPSGAPAPAAGWHAAYWAGLPSAGSGATDSCAQGGSLTAASSGAALAPNDGGPEWIFTAPGGATIAGGSVQATLSAPLGEAWLSTPLPAYDSANLLAACGQSYPCAGATASGTFPITHPGGTRLYAPAVCISPGQPTCPLDAAATNASVSIKASEVELAVPAKPAATSLGGGLLDAGAHGRADLRLTVEDPATGGGYGPGVYAVTVAIDGTTVYSGVPDRFGGRCVALGTDPATGGLIFDHTQPCAPSASISVPVSTETLGDGRHRLSVTASDAAGDTATVLTRTITTFNPQLSPLPAFDQVPARLTTGWSFDGAQTTLASLTATGLPAGGRTSVACAGRRCPAIAPASVPVASAGRIWRALEAVSFRPGQRLEVTIAPPPRHSSKHRHPTMTAGARSAERIVYTFRRGAQPRQTLAR